MANAIVVDYDPTWPATFGRLRAGIWLADHSEPTIPLEPGDAAGVQCVFRRPGKGRGW